MMRIFLIYALFLLLFSGCAQKRFEVLDLNDSEVRDLKELPQNPLAYIKNHQEHSDQEHSELYASQLEYEKKYYRIWDTLIDVNVTEVMWPHRIYNASRAFYGINLKRVESSFYERILERANFNDYMSIAKKALTVQGTDIRAFPTSKVLLKHPNKPGEGYPFDYLQNSYIAANKPLLVSHFSDDKKWAFVFSSFTSGWVKSEDIVLLTENDANVWMRAKQVHLFQDKEPVVDDEGYLFELRIGMMLPLVDENDDYYTLLAVKRGDLYTPVYKKLKVQKKYASTKPLAFSNDNIVKILFQLQKSVYGWGGMYGERDCSATMRDYFAPFGIWIGRNSSVQAKAGRVIELDGLEEDAKKALIKKEAVPFETLLYRRGHIMLYLGTYNGKIIVFQNLWGIKTRKGEQTGRVVIGRAVYSSLDIGRGVAYYDEESSLIKKLKSMNIVTLMAEKEDNNSSE